MSQIRRICIFLASTALLLCVCVRVMAVDSGSTSTILPSAPKQLLEHPRTGPPPSLGSGINFGNALESPHEGDWGVVLKEKDFDIVKQAGFDSIRLPARWSAHAGTQAPYALDPSFVARVDWAIAQARTRGLKVVLNIHHFTEASKEGDKQLERFIAIWRQLADHYVGQSEDLVFELLNEPNGALTTDVWNRWQQAALTVVRKRHPTRPIIVTSSQWDKIVGMEKLILPKDPNLILNIHYYEPMRFTHQGVEWANGANDAWIGTQWPNPASNEKTISADFNKVAVWARAHGISQVYLGEFGAYSKADMDSRERWTAAVRQAAEARGFSWAYWEFRAGFGAYDPTFSAWRTPLLRALLPTSPVLQKRKAVN